MIDLEKIKKLDVCDCFGSTNNLPKQILQAIEDVDKIKFPNSYRGSDLIALSGMGGSIYAAYVATSLFSENLTRPLVKINGYRIPKYVLRDTFFMSISYSGNTEETVGSTLAAIKDNDAVTAVTGGGKIAELMTENKLPFYLFDPKFNQCKAPRIGLGYTIFGPIMILAALEYLDLDRKSLLSAIEYLSKNIQYIQEKAYADSQKLKDSIITFISTNHLSGAVHIARNQMNETAKTMSSFQLIPELNHHMLEGLENPKNSKMKCVFYNSNMSHERNTKRLRITKSVFDKLNVPYIEVSFDVKNKMEEFLSYLSYGSYLSFFLGIENGVNPTTNPWVDYFKEEMAK
jgi:glucose/mannose-6-phosphate isomerase